MREVKIEELEIGDEIVIASQADFKYLRVLVKPRTGNKVHHYTKKPLYKAVKCSGRRDLIRHPNGFSYQKWIFSPEDHNFTQYINLEYRQILLVNRP